VISIEVMSKVGGALFDALPAALPMNLTLRKLSFWFDPSNDSGAHVDWSPTFLALGRNMGLKTLEVHGLDSMEKSLCTAMSGGLRLNETLESLELRHASMSDDTAPLWCRALSFLRTNTALKSLEVVVRQSASDSCLSTFRVDIAAMLQDNASLESLCIKSTDTTLIAENYVAFITALQHNRKLQKLMLTHYCGALEFNDNEDKRMAKILKKNYALESLLDIDLESGPGDVGAILRLNAAGRRYLIEDGSSVSKGVEVLISVRDDINCVFLHLLENPRLCNRSVVEPAIDSTEERRGSAYPEKYNGKRGQALDEGKESRRRRI
jgi:hypothetical protein